MAANGYTGGYADDERLQAARTDALALRPAEARRPQAVAWRVDDAHFRRAAAESYVQAGELYAAGRAGEGDLCITRGDGYAQVALLYAHANAAGVTPKLTVPPAEHDPEADPPSRARLGAKLLDAQRRGGRLVQPTVSSSAAADSSCNGLYYIAWGHALLAADSFAAGDDALGWYHIHEGQQYLIDWEACELAATLP
jgi:hypothetical protein